MPIEGLDSREQLVVVADVDEHLRVVLDALQLFRSEQGNGASAEYQIDVNGISKPGTSIQLHL